MNTLSGLVLFFGGGGPLSLDAWLMKRANRFWPFLSSGPFFNSDEGTKTVQWISAASILLFAFTLLTNQVNVGGVWGPFKNPAIKPHEVLSNASLTPEGQLKFTITRNGGPDTYGAFITQLNIIDSSGTPLFALEGKELGTLPEDQIQNLNAIRLVFELLRGKVSSPVSYTSIAEDVSISPNTVKKYIQILEALYVVFRITPYSKNIARSLLKEPKIYFFDTGLVKGDQGAKLENLVATCLLKHTFSKVDNQAEMYSLHYLHTKEKQEVDFALIRDQKIEKMIEVKYADATLSRSLTYFHEKYNISGVQVVKELKRERVDQGIEIVQASHFLKNLDL